MLCAEISGYSLALNYCVRACVRVCVFYFLMAEDMKQSQKPLSVFELVTE
jgi:hypothetical protein